jgi:hypothetical protein
LDSVALPARDITDISQNNDLIKVVVIGRIKVQHRWWSSRSNKKLSQNSSIPVAVFGRGVAGPASLSNKKATGRERACGPWPIAD